VLVLNPEGIRAMDWTVGTDGTHDECLALATAYCQRRNMGLRGDAPDRAIRDSMGNLH